MDYSLKNTPVYFASYDEFDKYTDYENLLFLSLPPRKMARKCSYVNKNLCLINNSILSPVDTAILHNIIPYDTLYTIAYTIILLTADIEKLHNDLCNKIILSEEEPNEYGKRMILIGFLSQIGFDCKELSNPTDEYTANCYSQYITELQLPFAIKEKDDLLFEDIIAGCRFDYYLKQFKDKITYINDGKIEEDMKDLINNNTDKELYLAKQRHDIAESFIEMLLSYFTEQIVEKKKRDSDE